MNSPVMQGLSLNTPAYVQHTKLLAWVADMAALCKPAQVYWCDGSDEEYARLCQDLVDSGTFKRLNPAKRLLGPLRCGARGRPNLHLLSPKRRRRPHQQLDGPGRDAQNHAALV